MSCSAGSGAGVAVGLAGADRAHAAPVPDLATASREVGARELTHRVPFDAYHQSGIVSPKAAQATFVALDSVASTTTALFEGLQAISSQARLLTQGEPVGVAEIDDPPPDSGILGSYNAPRSTSWTRRAPAATCSSRSAPASATPWCTPSAG